MKFCKTPVSAAIIAAATLTSSSAIAVQQGDWLVRTRIIKVAPSNNQITDMSGTPVLVPAGIDVDSAVTLDIDITYMFTNNFGVELLLDLTSQHDITGTGNASALGKIGEVTTLPPSLIAQYHFMPQNNIRPYAGAGINYTFFLSESTTDSLTNFLGAGSTGLKVDDSFGFVIQAGVDFDINKNWYWNLDAKYLFLDTTATITADGADVLKVDFDLDPLILGVGIGTRF